MEEQYNIEEINDRKQRLVDLLQERIYEYASVTDKEDFIIGIHVEEFSSQALEFESIYALKVVLEGLIEDYEMDTESVIYKLNKLLGNINGYESYQEMNNENSGYIYLMVNPSMNGIVKIGLTKRTPEERLDELSKATGVPTPFILVYKERFNDCVRAEKIIHSLLEERGERVSSNREFFSTETSEAIKIIQEVKENYDTDSWDLAEQSYDWYDDKPISKEYLEKGIDYLNGYGNYLQDYDKAIEYLEKAGELGEAQAYYELGNLYVDTMKEEEFTLDVKKAIKYFEKGRKLTGKYANYCNAGQALCYVNDYFTYAKIKNYTKNDANAEKCWKWFFENLDFNESDYLAGSHIFDFLNHFMLNNEVYDGYKKALDKISIQYITKCRYDLYKRTLDFSSWDKIRKHLLSKFSKNQLERNVDIEWLREESSYDEDGINFNIKINKGFLNKEDIISFNGNGGAYRKIKEIIKNGDSVDSLQLGDVGTLVVDSVLEDFDGYMVKSSSLEVIGNEVLEEKEVISKVDTVKVNESKNTNIENTTGKGILGKVKSWFG
ncbi:GIY-YIG nuclease family protein [Metasolibacillus sp. FSL K6-0083]|uniref:GIY-YIG nuclease family protein n=1 Tax=Metasolibacillus sp. FSL K6-0083 TaxID=2921416 RepID=UPI003159F11E